MPRSLAIASCGGGQIGDPIPRLTLYGVNLASRLLLGTSQYPSPAILADAARASGAEIAHRFAAARVRAT